jgi:hypothetical protein
MAAYLPTVYLRLKKIAPKMSAPERLCACTVKTNLRRP